MTHVGSVLRLAGADLEPAPYSAGNWAHVTPRGSLQNAGNCAAEGGPPRVSSAPTDEEKRGKGTYRRSCGPAARARGRPTGRSHWTWLREPVCSSSSSVGADDTRGTHSATSVRRLVGKLRAGLPFATQPAKLTVLRVPNCQPYAEDGHLSALEAGREAIGSRRRRGHVYVTEVYHE